MSKGGNGALVDGSYDYWNGAAGGGAGIPSGSGCKSSNAQAYSNGVSGCGGLLILYAKSFVLNVDSYLSAVGSAGGNATAGKSFGQYGASGGGGGSGGGSINVFTEKVEIPNNTNISSFIKISGGNGGNGKFGTGAYEASGGAGGTGSCNIGIITTGTYEPYYSNN